MEYDVLLRNDTYILIPAYKPDNLMIELLTNLKKQILRKKGLMLS